MARKVIDALSDETDGGALSKYKRLRVGESGWLTFLGLELVTTLFTNLPGALGLLLRGFFYRPFFAEVGPGSVFGMGIVIRDPKHIRIGRDVILDDYCVLDAKGDGQHAGIEIGDRTFISRNAVLSCKSGHIKIGSGVSLGLNSTIHSVDSGTVEIGDHTVVAGYCYFIGAPGYLNDRTDIPMAKQGFEEVKGIKVGEDVWIGASVSVLDGATIGEGSIIGAKALVRGDLPPYCKAMGVPAEVKGFRGRDHD